jgi:hypothetical protein
VVIQSALVDTIRAVTDVQTRLEDQEGSLSKLIARRTIFHLCSRPYAARSFLTSQTKLKGLPKVFEYVYLAASEALNLARLESLGSADGQYDGAYETMMTQLQTNVADFLSSSGTADEVCEMVFAHTRALLETSAKFTTANTFTLQWSISPASKDEQMVESIKVKGASALVLLFARETKLQQGSTLSVYSNENCTDLVKSYESKSDQPVLSPLTVPSPDAWLQVPRPKDMPCSGQVRVIPVHSSLGLACWIIDFMLDTGVQWASALAASGGMSGLCYEFCQMILENYNLEKLAPSPLKEALLRLISKMLTKINEIRGERILKHGFASPEQKLLPRISRQVSVAKSSSQTTSLATLKNLNQEMMDLFKAETSEEVFTSYLQQLVDLMAVTDNLRPAEQKLCKSFEFKLPLSEEEKKKQLEDEAKAAEAEKETEWSCEVCTMLNPIDSGACDMCGSPKPKAQPKKKKAGGTAGASGGADVSQQMFHDMMALVATMRYLNGTGTIADTPAVKALMDSAHKELKIEKVQDRMFVIENVPSGAPDLVKRALTRVLRQVCETVRIDHIYLGVDSDKPELKALAPREQPKKAGKTAFAWTYNFDKNGILNHLATSGGTSVCVPFVSFAHVMHC